MIQLQGRVYEIHEISEKEAQIVIKKKIGDKIVPVAINVFGFFYEKIKKDGLKQGDKISAKLYLKSKFWEKGQRYFTDAYFKDVIIIERSNTIQFSGKKLKFDTDTGEIFDK